MLCAFCLALSAFVLVLSAFSLALSAFWLFFHSAAGEKLVLHERVTLPIHRGESANAVSPKFVEIYLDDRLPSVIIVTPHLDAL